MGAISNCGTCVHWIPQQISGGAITIGAENTPGECHHSPPLVQVIPMVNGQLQIRTTFPMPHSNMWCGQHGVSE